MNFKTHNETEVNTNMTSLMDNVTATFDQLVKAFGEPHESDGYKSDAEWDVEFEDGSVATIYNWKDGKNYRGANGLDVTDITDWHVGGHDNGVVQKVRDAIKSSK